MNSSSNRKKLFEGAEMQQRYKEQRMEIMEEQNNQLTDTLDERIGALKGLTIELGDEAREHNRLLDEMELDFSSADGLLKSTMEKLSHMIRTGGSKHMCYLALFALCIFVFLYFIMSW